MNLFFHDFRHAARSLLRQPLFTGVSLLVLALGIGANTAVFSVVNTVLLRPLPYPKPSQLVLLRENTTLSETGSVSLPNYLDWRASQQTFTDLALLSRGTFNFSLPNEAGAVLPTRLNAANVSANYLSVLQIRPRLGRDFTPADDVPGAAKVALISDGLWRHHYGANPAVVGQAVMLDSESYEIVGVLPSTFGYPRLTEVLTPLADIRKEPWATNRGNHPGFSVVGRLRDGVSMAAAQSNLHVIAQALAKQYPDTNTGRGIAIRSLLESTVGSYRHGLYLLLGAVACVLLIACANVANLQLARANGRTRELAVRAALGAGRGRLVRQLLTESTLLGLLGGAFGLLLAMWVMDTVVALAPADVPRFHDIHLDWTALGFAAAVALLTGLLVGLWPAWRVSGLATMATALHEGAARGGTGGLARVRTRAVLVVAQVAMAVILLAGAGLALRSFWRMSTAPLGFRPEGVLTMSLSLPDIRYKKADDKEAPLRFFDALLDRVRALPGVESAACAVNMPFDNNEWDNTVHVTGTPPYPLGQEPSAEFSYVSPDYFRVLGIPVRRGRVFDGRERLNQPRSVVVDESFVRKFFPHVDPIGKLLDDNQTPDVKDPPPMTIVGVVPRTRNDVPEEDGYLDRMTQMYLPSSQLANDSRWLLVHVASGDPKRLVEAIRQVVVSLDPEVPIAEVATMQENIDVSLASQRLTMTLLSTFAVLALALSSLGLYGVMALGVTQRTRELGIRLALGAPRAAVLVLVLRQAATLVGFGLCLGWLGAWVSGRLLATVLYGVKGSDLLTLGVVTTVLAGAALLACWLPARRATRVDPLVALREE